MQLFKGHPSSKGVTVSILTTKKTLQASLNYMWQEQTIMPIKKNHQKKQKTHMQWQGLDEEAQHISLTQAGGSVTHFVRLVKQSSRENRKVSGLAV